MCLNTNNLDFIDHVAGSFEDFVSRGEVIDMMAEFVMAKKLEDRVFGRQTEEGGEADSS